MPKSVLLLALLVSCLTATAQVDHDEVCLNRTEPDHYALPGAAATLQHPILFVTQMPLGADMQTRMSAFGHHGGQPHNAGRGGDLYILHPPSDVLSTGCLRNLTREAGFGEAGMFQGSSAIAVREPYLHPGADRALFSMVIGAPEDASGLSESYYWQIYQISGLGLGDMPIIEQVAGQPPDYNNVSPVYAPGGGILFTSDLPIGGPANRHLYPPRDEYELMPTTLGLWWLDPEAGPDSLRMLTHNPSGVFTPLIDSFGRVLLVSWDHLQRDIFQFGLNGRYSWNLSDESPDATLTDNHEYFPDPQDELDPEIGAWPHYGSANTHDIKLFFLWELTTTELPGGQLLPYTGMEILNHLGRHQLAFYFEPNWLKPDNGLEYFSHPTGRARSLRDGTLFPAEDPNVPGRYWFTDGQHFTRNATGPIFYLDAPPGRSPDEILPVPVAPADEHGRYRNALPLASGQILAVHTPTTEATADHGTIGPNDHWLSAPNYLFRLHLLDDADDDGLRHTGPPVLPLIERELQVWGVVQGRLTEYGGAMSQLDPVEVRPRPASPPLRRSLPAPELAVFGQRAIDPAELSAWLAQRELALIVVRDATTRDDADRQQPFNLFVQDHPEHASNTGHGASFPIQYLQIFQGDMVRVFTYAGVADGSSPDTPPENYHSGRRVLAVPQHDGVAVNLPFQPSPETTAPLDAAFRASARKVAEDGSLAAFVPASRALSWQLTDADGAPIVRERYWLTFQPGEIRVCGSCHGLDTHDQLGRPEPTNLPQALDELLVYWSYTLRSMLFRDRFQ